MRIRIIVSIIIVSLLFSQNALSAVTNNTIRIEEIIPIAEIVKPHTLNNSKEVSLKPGSISMQGFWSPDGGKILINSMISWDQFEGMSEIYVMNADGTELNRIASSKKIKTKGAWIANPIWSPSGDRIIFQLTQPGSILAVINPDGTGLKAIATNLSDMESILSFLPNAGWWQRRPQWSPDMTKMAFEFEKESTEYNRYVSNEFIYITDADGSNPIILHSDIPNTSPRWSHNSRKIIFTTIGDQYSLIRINSDGTDLKYLLNMTEFSSYQWSPDDSKILYLVSKEINGRKLFDIYTINENGTGNTKIFSGDGWIEKPSRSPDGSKILFQEILYENDIRTVNVYIIDADGKNLRKILKGDIKMLSWSPSGEKIAFEDNHSIYTMNPDGTGKVLLALTGWGVLLQQPVYAWSPSGNKIAFSAIIDPVTGKQVDFETFWLRRNSYEAHIFLTNLDGTEPVQLTTNGQSYVIYGDWSPDGSRLIIGSLDNEMEIYNVSIIKLSGHDGVISVYAPLFIEQGEDFVIEVKSMSKPLEMALITLNDKEIGVTNEKGDLKYSLKEPGRYLLNVTKEGYKTATKTIFIKENEKVPEQKETEIKGTIQSAKIASTPEAPGFTIILSILGLMVSLFYHFKKRRRVL